MRDKIYLLGALIALLSAVMTNAENVIIRVDTAKPGPAVKPQMYGIFLEEINHGVDGGLYAELVRNRGFEDARPPEGYAFRNGRWRDAKGFDAGFSRYGYVTNGIPFWSLVKEGDAQGTMHLETQGGVSAESSFCMRLDIGNATGGRIGVANDGFFGIGVRQGETYSLSFFARTGQGCEGPLLIRLEDNRGEPCSDEVKVQNMAGNWQRFTGSLTGSRTHSKARLVITAGAKGQVWLDFVSLFPARTWKDRTNGMRADVAQMIADLRPGFVRFPGGCVVEGGTVETAYNWKLTVGALEKRQERWGPWNYRQTHGMGLFEYLQFIEDIGAEPLWVGFDGQTCIYREREHVPMEEMGWVRDNFLDLVEYANGPVSSTWGAMRAQAGHPAPFGLKYVEIGNENQGREYAERYRYVHEAMKARYPNLTYLADLSMTSRESMSDVAFDIEDQHYYNNPRWFTSRFNAYDQRQRSLPPLYLGEVAVTSQEGGPLRGNLHAALAEGVFLMGCERNADVVRMVSYAPLLGHVDGRTELTGAPPPWHAMIYFDGTRSFGTVSYYLWKLFGVNRPSHTVQTDISFPSAKPVTVAGRIGVGTWDATAEFKDVRVESGGRVLYVSSFDRNAEGWNPDGGRWNVAEGAYRQERRGQGLSYLGEESWTDYTLTLKARKLSGGEGFLIVFGRKGGERYWWNLGGWGNSQHAIEFNQTLVGQPVRGHIETNRWYDIKVEVTGRRIRCYLDSELVHDPNAPDVSRFFASAGFDKLTGDLVVKAVNMAQEPARATLSMAGTNRLSSGAEITTLRSDRLDDNNSLGKPVAIVPTSTVEPVTGDTLTHEFPAYSFSVIRCKIRQP